MDLVCYHGGENINTYKYKSKDYHQKDPQENSASGFL